MAFAALAAGYILLINLLAFALFGMDKRRATEGGWRIPEATLIKVAAAGGWPGAKAGQRRFRHKTRKQPFGRRLNAAGLLNLGLLALLGAAFLAPSQSMGALRAAAHRVAELAADGAGEADAEVSPAPMPRRFGPGSVEGM